MAYKINDLTALGRNLDPTDLLEVSLTGATGSRKMTGSQLANGVGGINAALKPYSGLYYTQFVLAGGFDYSFYGSANFMNLAAYAPINTYSISEIVISCNIASVGQEVKLLIYSDVNGAPSTNLLTSTALSLGTIGLKTFTTSFTFEAGKKYWIGMIQKTNGTPSINGGTTSYLLPLYSNTIGLTFNALTTSFYSYTTPPSTVSIANFSGITSNDSSNYPMLLFKAV